MLRPVPSGVHTGWPTLLSSGIPLTAVTSPFLMSSTKSLGEDFPVFSSPQSSCSHSSFGWPLALHQDIRGGSGFSGSCSWRGIDDIAGYKFLKPQPGRVMSQQGYTGWGPQRIRPTVYPELAYAPPPLGTSLWRFALGSLSVIFLGSA